MGTRFSECPNCHSSRPSPVALCGNCGISYCHNCGIKRGFITKIYCPKCQGKQPDKVIGKIR